MPRKQLFTSDVKLQYMWLTDALRTKKVYNGIYINETWESSQRSIHSQFIRISHVKSQPITKKHFAQEYKFLRPTDEHSPFGLCLRLDNDIYHSLYSILDFDWLIHLQITACKYRLAANNWYKYFIEHAHFENASSASIKKIFLSKCQHGSFCPVIRKQLD